MGAYLKIVIENKVRGKKDFFNNYITIDSKHNILFKFVIIVSSLLRFTCSVVTVMLLNELFLGTHFEYLIQVLNILFLYFLSQDNQKFSEIFFKKNYFYFFMGSKTSKTFFQKSLLALVIVDTILKLDVILPFIVYFIKEQGNKGVFLVFLVLITSMVTQCLRLAKKVAQLKSTSLKFYLNKIILGILGIWIANRIFYLMVIVIESMKSLMVGDDYYQVNIAFENQIKSWFSTLLPKVSVNINTVIIILSAVILIKSIVELKTKADYLWLGMVKSNASTIKIGNKQKHIFSLKNAIKIYELPYYKKMLSAGENSNPIHVLLDNLEILILYYITFLVLSKLDNIFASVFCIVVFYLIGNSNLANSYVVKYENVFRNYLDIDKMIYWKNSKYDIVGLYKIKTTLLQKMLIIPSIEMFIISYVVSLLAVKNLILITIVHILLAFLTKRITLFNSELSTFMVPYLFSKNYPLLRKSNSATYEINLYEKVYNFYKFPLIMLMILPLLLQVFINFFTAYVFAILLIAILIYCAYVSREMRLLVTKGGREYEKVSI